MNILILSQYFWPENFRINELANELNKSKDIKIYILTCNPSYPNKNLYKKKIKKLKNLSIFRVPVYLRDGTIFSKYLNYITFVITATFYLLFINKIKFQKIFVFQVSPVFSAIPAIIYSIFNKTKIYIWVLDLWPESIRVFGFNSKFIFYLIKKISDYIYSRSDILLAQSNSLVKILKKRYRKKTFYLPNWSEKIIEKKINSGLCNKIKKKYQKNKINIFFGGNIGKGQDFKSLLKAISITNNKSQKFNWFIFGEGSEKKKIQQEIINKYNIKNIFFFNSVSQNNLLYIFKKYADFLLVTLAKSETLKWTVPGKIQFYFQSKKPLIGMIDGEAKFIIQKSNSGFVVNSGNYFHLSKLLLRLSEKIKKDKYKKKGINGFKFTQKYFNKKKNN